MPTLPRDTGWLLIVVYVFGLVLLMTVGLHDGGLAETPFLLVVACGALLVAQFTRLLTRRQFHHDSARPMLTLAAVALTVFVIAAFADSRLLLDAERAPRFIPITHAGQVVLLASYLPPILRGVPERRLWSEVRFVLFAVFLLLGGISVMLLSPRPHGGIFGAQTEAVQVLLHGGNPYRAPTSFAEAPVVLGLCTAALVAGADVRWATLLVLLAAGFALRFIARYGVSPRVPSNGSYAGRDRGRDATTAKASVAGAALARARAVRASVSEVQVASPRPFSGLAEDAPTLMLWLTPKIYFFIEQSYSDVLPVTFVAFAILAHMHERRTIGAVLLGFALASKQSMVWLLPLAILLDFDAKHWAAFFAAVLLTLVPFVAWDPRAMLRLAADLYGAQAETVASGISATSWFYQRYGLAPRGAPGLAAATLVSVLAAIRGPHTRYAFALSTMLAFFVFCVLGRSMPLGAYFFLTALGALTAAVAVGDRFEMI